MTETNKEVIEAILIFLDLFQRHIKFAFTLNRQCQDTGVLRVEVFSYIRPQEETSTSNNLSVFGYRSLKLSKRFYTTSKIGKNEWLPVYGLWRFYF